MTGEIGFTQLKKMSHCLSCKTEMYRGAWALDINKCGSVVKLCPKCVSVLGTKANVLINVIARQKEG